MNPALVLSADTMRAIFLGAEYGVGISGLGYYALAALLGARLSYLRRAGQLRVAPPATMSLSPSDNARLLSLIFSRDFEGIADPHARWLMRLLRVAIVAVIVFVVAVTIGWAVYGDLA